MEVLFVNKKIINSIIIYIVDFIISANICYNLTHIIKNNIKLGLIKCVSLFYLVKGYKSFIWNNSFINNNNFIYIKI